MNLADNNVRQRAREIVQRILYVTIATVSENGKPWNSPVYSSYDNDGNFYWTSTPEAQHSRNIVQNGRAFLVIYDSTVPEGSGMGGVYVEVDAVALSDAQEIAEARMHTALRVGHSLDDQPERYLNGGVRRVYRATPKRVWMNDVEEDEYGNFVRDIRIEIPVATLQDLVTW